MTNDAAGARAKSALHHLARNGTPGATTAARIDSALVKALARGHRWQRLLESGECASITELAAAEKIDRSYLCRVLRLTLLAPEIVEGILDGRQPEGVTLPALMKGFPVEWDCQSFPRAAR